MALPQPIPEWQDQDSRPLRLVHDRGDLNLLPPEDLQRPLWKSLLRNFGDLVSPESLPPLHLSSRPVDLGMPVSDRLSIPWYRTIFGNLGDVISPEALPPLDLESTPVDVGELITDQLSHPWYASFLRNLADVVAPERQSPLPGASAPDNTILPVAEMLLPRWSSVIDGPKIFYPDLAESAYLGHAGQPPQTSDTAAEPEPNPILLALEFFRSMEGDLKSDLRRSRIRKRIWISLAALQAAFLLAGFFKIW